MKRHVIGLVVLLGLLASCGGGGDSSVPQVPQGAYWPTQTIRVATAPAGFGSVLGWMQATTLDPSTPPNGDKVEIAWVRLIERDTAGSERILSETRYDQPGSRFGCDFLTYCDGGLFERSPWFGTNNFLPIEGSAIENGALILPIGSRPDRVTHWWTPLVDTAPGAHYFLELSIRVTGRIAFQAGSDYWHTSETVFDVKDNGTCFVSNNCEAWDSDWLGDTGGAFVVFRAPHS